MKQIYSIPYGMATALLLIAVFSFSAKAQISSEACQTVLHDRTYEQMRREASIIHYTRNKVRGRGEAASADTIPVFFTVFRNDDGSFADPEIDETRADQALQELNRYFAPIQLVFVRLGAINYIDNTPFTNFSRHHHLARFSYVSSALNVYSKSGSSSFAQFPSVLGPTETYNPNGPASDRSNMLSLNSHHFLTTSFAHEMGHSFGLLHTFEGAQIYNNPLAPTPGYQQSFTDHPYGESGNIRRRELVIRQETQEKPFAVSNASTAGDFVTDTPAFCVSTNTFPDYYPDLNADNCASYPFDRSRCNGCIVVDCNYEGNYVDYNGDTLINTEVSIRNLMSYTSCRSEFTPGQYERMAFYHEQVRQLQYDHLQEINFRGKVTFEDSGRAMDDVVVQLSHPGQSRYCNMTTGSDGAFQGIRYAPWVSARLLKAGTDLDPDYRLSPWVEASLEDIVAHSYHREDWIKGVDTADLALLRQHLSGAQSLNGYRQLAADLNADGQLTAADLDLMEQLINGQLRQLVNHPSPWRFLPAYIPEHHPARFHENPFQMELNGVAYHRFAPYLEEDWLYKADDLSGPENDFRGIKIGDLNGSSEGLVPAPETTTNPSGIPLARPDVKPDLVSQLKCFPNPTAGKLTVNLHALENAEGTLLISDRMLRPVIRREVNLNAGENVFYVEASDLPNGVVIISLQTQEKTYFQRVIKISGS